MLSPPEVDKKILELSELLEAQAKTNYRQAIAGAEAEAEYRKERALAQLRVRAAAAARNEKLTEATVEAAVDQEVADYLSTRLIAQAKHEAGRDALFATRARLDALRTIAASTREAAKG